MTLRRLACLLLGHRYGGMTVREDLMHGTTTASFRAHCLRCGEPHP